MDTGEEILKLYCAFPCLQLHQFLYDYEGYNHFQK